MTGRPGDRRGDLAGNDFTRCGDGVAIRLHRRQFVIGPRFFAGRGDWRHLPLSGTLHLSHCPECRVDQARDRNGVVWTLIGLAVETDAGRPDPLVAVAQAPTVEVEALRHGWAGRWLLVGNGEIFMDASGLLGCFHGHDRNGRTWASSSPALALEVLGQTVRAGRSLGYERGISWFPPPCSAFSEVARLLPSQVLEVETGSVRAVPLMPQIDAEQDPDRVVGQIARLLTEAMRRVTVLSPNGLWLGLTGGYDSRTMLAIAYAAGIEIVPFTRLAARMSAADRVLPPQLASRCGYRHVFLRGAKPGFDRQDVVRAHSVGHVSEGDAQPVLSGVRDAMEGVAIGGHGFSIASGFASWRRLPAELPPPGAGASMIMRRCGEPVTSEARQGLEAWLDWVRATPHRGLDWRDRMFIEQRQAGWLSSKEQLYDMMRLARFPILNCARVNALLLGLGESQRLGSLLQVALVERLAPQLSNIPFNPPDSQFVLRHPLHVARRQSLRMSRRVTARVRRLLDDLPGATRPRPGTEATHEGAS